MKLLYVLIGAISFQSVQSQDCTPWFPFHEGTSFEYTFFSPKDKQTGRVAYEVTEVKEDGDNYVAIVSSEIFDKKDKSAYKFDFEVICEEGSYRADFSNFINPTMKEAFGSAEVSVSGDDLVIPKELAVGMELPDATTLMETSLGAIGMKSEMNFTDRKIVEKVDVETPIKTFSAYKMTGKEHLKMSIIDRTYETVYYYTEGYGQVKSEVYDKKGKLDSYMLLTKFEK